MKKIVITTLIVSFTLHLSAQSSRNAYFMDKYHNRTMLNPAMTPAWGYVNIPVFGNIFGGTENNMALSKLLHPNKETNNSVTFLHKSISSSDAMKKISNRGESLDGEVCVTVLGFGFYTKRDRFWSFDLNVKGNVGMNLPKDLFAFLKEVDLGNGKMYNFNDLSIASRAYVELAFGHARDVNESIRVGSKVKLLVGAADVRLKMDELSVYSDKETYRLAGRGTGSALNGGYVYLDDSNKIQSTENYADLLGNYGAAFDLGVTWQMDKFLESVLPVPLKGFTASFGITDLGFIHWKSAAQVSIDKSFVYEGVRIKRSDSNTIEMDMKYIDDQINDIKDNLLETEGTEGGMFRGLRTTTNVGLEYSFLRNKMSAGLLWSTHFGLPRVYNELTLSYNLRPCNWFAMTLSSGIAHGAFRSVGWALHLTPKYGFNLFLGMDYVPIYWTGKVTRWEKLKFLPLGLPIYSTNLNFNFGLTVPLGGNRYHKFPSKRELRRKRLEEQQKTQPATQEGVQLDTRNVYQSEGL